MRRDVFIENDSGGLSILSADAVDAIIEDRRGNDGQFVVGHKAMLLELYGDDSMPVRIVVDEPLRDDESAQWLARATWRLDTSDGRMLVMGGFDPDVLSDWKEDVADGGTDGGGIATFNAGPGSWRVDVYAHVGSMNGRVLLTEMEERPGAAFRRSHPGRPFPLWLARMLEHSGEDDPGFEHLWRDVAARIADGSLAVDTEQDAIGFLVHLTQTNEAVSPVPRGGWFDRSANSRIPAVFPVGLRSEVVDPELESFRNRILGRKAPQPERAVADRVVQIIEVWTGDTLKRIEGGSVSLAPNELYLLHWLAALASDSPPRFELWVERKGAWSPPAATPDFAVMAKGATVTAIGPAANLGGWQLWWSARNASAMLTEVPNGSTIDFATAPRLDDADSDDTQNPAVGRTLYSGTMKGGTLEISDSSPRVTREVLDEAVEFVRRLARDGSVEVRDGAERVAFDATSAIHSPEDGSVVWAGTTARLAEPDIRTILILASPVFRTRFGHQWTVDPIDTEW